MNKVSLKFRSTCGEIECNLQNPIWLQFLRIFPCYKGKYTCVQRLFFGHDRAVAVVEHRPSVLFVENKYSFAPRSTDSAVLCEGEFKGIPL